MRKINSNDLEELTWGSPKGKFGAAGRQVSEASAGNRTRRMRAIAIRSWWRSCASRPVRRPTHTLALGAVGILPRDLRRGLARDETGHTPIVAGDAFMFGPGEAHTFRTTARAISSFT